MIISSTSYKERAESLWFYSSARGISLRVSKAVVLVLSRWQRETSTSRGLDRLGHHPQLQMPKTAGMSCPPEVCAAGEASGTAEEYGLKGIEIIWAVPHSTCLFFVGFKYRLWRCRRFRRTMPWRGGRGSKCQWNLHVSFLFTYCLSHCLPWSFPLPLSVAATVGINEKGAFSSEMMCCAQKAWGPVPKPASLPSPKTEYCLPTWLLFLYCREKGGKKEAKRHRKVQWWIGTLRIMKWEIAFLFPSIFPVEWDNPSIHSYFIPPLIHTAIPGVCKWRAAGFSGHCAAFHHSVPSEAWGLLQSLACSSLMWLHTCSRTHTPRSPSWRSGGSTQQNICLCLCFAPSLQKATFRIFTSLFQI